MLGRGREWNLTFYNNVFLDLLAKYKFKHFNFEKISAFESL
jgi:hypothetical protein